MRKLSCQGLVFVVANPGRNVPMLTRLEVSSFLRFSFLALCRAWSLLLVLVVAGVVVESRRGAGPDRSPAEPEGRNV